MSSGSILMVLYFCVWIGVGLYVLMLASRMVGAHERIARALEDAALKARHEDK